MLVLIFFCAAAGVMGLCLSHFVEPQSLESAQLLCKSWAPDSEFQDLYRAIVCGTSLSSLEFKQTFINTGLIHILVVSGSHLLFLDQIAAHLNISPKLRLFCIHLPFTCLAGFQPPVVRALSQRALTGWKQLRLTSCQSQGLITAVLLLAVPAWARSLSFQLSWMCGLLLALPRISRLPSGLETAAKIFCGLLPFSAALGLISPLSILTNWLIAPLIGCLLFPVSALCFVFPWLTPGVDALWRATTQALASLPAPPPSDLTLVPNSQLIWIPLSAQILLLLIEVPWWRKNLFSVS